MTMSATLRRSPFTVGAEFVVRRAFHFGGKPYAIGASFHWRRESCSERKLRLLWEGRFIEAKSGLEEASASVSRKSEGKSKGS